MKPTLFDIFPTNEPSRILETLSDIADAFDYCRAQEGMELTIMDRRKVYMRGSHGRKAWQISLDGTVTAILVEG
jgi:hypothetical protein